TRFGSATIQQPYTKVRVRARFFFSKSTSGHFLTEFGLAQQVGILLAAPLPISLVQLTRIDRKSIACDATIRDKPADRFHLAPVPMRCKYQLTGRIEPVSLPFQASAQRPSENARKFLAQFIRQVTISLSGWNQYGERNRVDAAPNCNVAP